MPFRLFPTTLAYQTFSCHPSQLYHYIRTLKLYVSYHVAHRSHISFQVCMTKQHFVHFNQKYKQEFFQNYIININIFNFHQNITEKKKIQDIKLMRLSLNQSSPQSLSSINKVIQNYPFHERMIEFKSLYVFQFDMNHVYIPECRQTILNFCNEFFRLLLLNMLNKSHEEEWKQQIASSSLKIKFLYCELMEKFVKQKLRLKVELVFFVITLLSPNFFEEVLDRKYRNNEDFLDEDLNIFSVEQYVYIVLIFQTVGTLISPQAFKYLKGKYIKRILYKSDRKLQCLGLMNSLRHIRKQMTTQDCFMGERKLKDKDMMSSTNMIKFVRDNLKTKFEYSEKQKKTISPLMESIHQTFYWDKSQAQDHLSQECRSGRIIQRKKVMTKQLSQAAITFYGLKQYQPRFKSATRLSLFKTKSQQKKISDNFQTFFPEEEKREKKPQCKQSWQSVLSNIRSSSTKQVGKIEKIPRRLHQKHTHQHKYSASSFVPCGIKAKTNKRLSVLKQQRQQTLDFQTDLNLQQIMSNKYFNLKSYDEESDEVIKLLQKGYPCSSRKLRKNQIQFHKKSNERDEKIKDSFLNITYKVT